MAKLIIDAEREAYSIAQIEQTMTVGELMAFLEQFEEDAEIVLRHDRGYTYGAVNEWKFEFVYDYELEEDE